MSNNWMYFNSIDPEDDEEILYDTLANREETEGKKHEMIRCFACGAEEYAMLDSYGRFVCDACKAWEKKNLGG